MAFYSKNKENEDEDDYVYTREVTHSRPELENLRVIGDDDDFLQIKPQQSSKRKHRDDHHSYVKYESHGRKKHSRREKHREKRHKATEDRDRERHHHRRKHHHHEHKTERSGYDKGNLSEPKYSDSCKYDVQNVKDFRNSNHESETRRIEKQNNSAIKINKKLSEILEDDFQDDDAEDDYYDEEPSVQQEDEPLQVSNDEQEESAEEEDDQNGSVDDKNELDSDSSDSDTSKHQKTEEDGAEEAEEQKDSDNSGTDTNPNSPQLNESKDDYPSPINNIDNESNDEVKKIDETLPPYYPAIEGCRNLDEFQCLNRIAEGTYGVVYRFKDKRTDDIVALKKLKMEKEKEGFPITSLREINTLLKGQHPNIVTVREIVVGSNMDKIFIVMDYVEHDLKSLIETMRKKNQLFTPGEVKCLLKQLLSAVAHLHDNWILHRDLKTSNLLLSHKGVLKVGDFGLAREYGSPLRPYTPIVVTLWYRAPELLLCTKEYSAPIDMWSVGCIFAEFLLMNAFFPGKSEVEQINRIFKCLGTPNEKVWPGYNNLPAVQKMKFNNYSMSNLRKKFQMLSDLGLNFLLKFLTYDPQQRITAEDALKHPYFNEFPIAIDPTMFPTWPAKSEMGHKRAASPKPPSGGGEFKKLGGDEDGFRIGLETDNRERIGAGFSLKF